MNPISRFIPRKFTLFNNYKYSIDRDNELFYLWLEKMIIPIILSNEGKLAKEMRKIIYESINTPYERDYYVYTYSVERYLEENSFTIEAVSEGKKMFKYRVQTANLMGKELLLKHYRQEQIPIAFIDQNKE